MLQRLRASKPDAQDEGKVMACRLAVAFAAATIGICLAVTDASAACKFKPRKDVIVIVDVGHSDKDSGQISARSIKEYDLNLKLAGRVLALQLPFLSVSESMGNHDSQIVDAGSVN